MEVPILSGEIISLYKPSG
jgi:hypothetical protein